MTQAPHHRPSAERSPVHPLDDFYAWNQRPLIPYEVISPAEMPEPARSLLVHERDMTRTLEQFHLGSLHLRVISRRRNEESYWRESVLELDGSNQPVEFGAIRIDLSRFAEPWRSRILEEHLPLGGISTPAASGTRAAPPPTSAFSQMHLLRVRCIFPNRCQCLVVRMP